MIAKRLQHTLLTAFAPLTVLLVAPGCTRSQPPSAAQGTLPAQAKPVHPSVVGTVLVTSTHKPPPSGGVVYLEDAPKQPGALMHANIVIHHKDFLPFITVLTVGGTATFSNHDPMPHHVFSPQVKGWDTGFLKHGHPVSKTFDTPGPKALLCNIHPEMLGYLLVIRSTYFGKIGADGKYVIGDVPAGTYKAVAWVPRANLVTKPVTVTATGTVTQDFEVVHVVPE